MENITNIPSKEEQERVIEKAGNLIRDMQKEAINKMPMWVKLNFILNMVSAHKDSEIDWKNINDILSIHSEYDFNNYEYPINSVSGLMDARATCNASSILNMVWQRHTCKDCGTEFTLLYSEVEFYREHEFNVPKRCKSCRDKRKNMRSVVKDK